MARPRGLASAAANAIHHAGSLYGLQFVAGQERLLQARLWRAKPSAHCFWLAYDSMLNITEPVPPAVGVQPTRRCPERILRAAWQLTPATGRSKGSGPAIALRWEKGCVADRPLWHAHAARRPQAPTQAPWTGAPSPCLPSSPPRCVSAACSTTPQFTRQDRPVAPQALTAGQRACGCVPSRPLQNLPAVPRWRAQPSSSRRSAPARHPSRPCARPCPGCRWVCCGYDCRPQHSTRDRRVNWPEAPPEGAAPATTGAMRCTSAASRRWRSGPRRCTSRSASTSQAARRRPPS